jgi:hypothetical protein
MNRLTHLNVTPISNKHAEVALSRYAPCYAFDGDALERFTETKWTSVSAWAVFVHLEVEGLL